MFDELDVVALVTDLKDYNLKAGDIGTITHVYKDKKAVEVEFVNGEGKTVALITVKTSDIRPIARNEILHARGVATVPLG
mgnify:CR=1 FL=1